MNNAYHLPKQRAGQYPQARARTRRIRSLRQANYWRQVISKGWTLERRARQAELVRQWRPWEISSGPKTDAGKAIVARNAWNGGERQTLRELSRLLRAQREALAYEERHLD